MSWNFSAYVSAESPSNISPKPSEVISEVSEPYDNHFGDFSNGGKSESKKRLITKNSGLPKLLRWLHALCSDQNSGLPKLLCCISIGFVLLGVCIVFELVSTCQYCSTVIFSIKSELSYSIPSHIFNFLLHPIINIRVKEMHKLNKIFCNRPNVASCYMFIRKGWYHWIGRKYMLKRIYKCFAMLCKSWG